MADPNMTGGVLRGLASGLLVLVLAVALVACGGGEETVAEETGRGEATREVEVVGRYPLPGRPLLTQGIAYGEETGDFFVGSAADGAVFRGNVSNEGEEAEVFLEPGTDGRVKAAGMKVDGEGRLFIAGGDTARIFVYDTGSGDLIQALDTPESENTFINDVTIAPDGNAYFTDPERPAIFEVPDAQGGGVGEAKEWFVPEYPPVPDEGFNLQGIVATGDGRYLISVQSNLGTLYRIDLASKEIVEIDLGEGVLPLASGAGLVLDGQTLYVTRSRADSIAPVELSEDFASGEVGENFTNPAFNFPTTIAKADDRLLVVNYLPDRREPGEEQRSTVLSVEIPPQP